MLALRSLAGAFARDRGGSVAILFGMSCIVLFGLIGLAVDTSRYYNYTSRLQVALDAAALAGAKLLPDESLSDSDIAALITANFQESMKRSGVKAEYVQMPAVTIDRNTHSVQVDGKALLPAIMSRLLTETDQVNVARSSKVVFDMKKVELSMVLDITGSMNDRNKLADMKIAAKDVIDELYNGSMSENGVRIALAPYSASVNAGKLASKVTDIPSTTTCSWVWYQWKCRDMAGVDQDTCVVERQGANAETDAAPVGADRLPNIPSPAPANYFCPPATVLGLQGKSQRDSVKDTIDSYAAVGGTAGHIGAAWGWYLLSPAWADVLGASAPSAYGESDIDKSMIVMTDGIFNTAYGSGSMDPMTQANASYAQFDALCSGAKEKGIKIFTVGFDLNDARALSELEKCATGPSNFFDAKTGADLKAAFKAIAQKLNTLRVAS